MSRHLLPRAILAALAIMSASWFGQMVGATTRDHMSDGPLTGALSGHEISSTDTYKTEG